MDTLLMKKGIKSLKENGLKYTYEKAISYINSRRITKNELLLKKKCNKFSGDIKFSIITPLYNTDIRFLKEMIESVISQSYQNWQLCLIDASDKGHKDIGRVVLDYKKNDNRIVYKKINQNLGISNNTNEGLSLADGEYVCFLDHDDLLTTDALLENYLYINNNEEVDVLYSDECHLTIDGKLSSPFFKPDWSPDLLYCQNYICHFLVAKRELVNKVGLFSADYDGSQDYDMILKLSEYTNNIHHIPKLLYIWRESCTSTALSSDAKPYAHVAGKKALEAHLKRKYSQDAVVFDGNSLFTYDPCFFKCSHRKVSIIIPFKDALDITVNCVNSILKNTDYNNYEIILLNNKSKDVHIEEKLIERILPNNNTKIYKAEFEFNWSKLNNFGIDKAVGDFFVFLNNDTKVISRDWIKRLVIDLERDEIGVVGALLTYEDGTIQHAGVIVGLRGWADHLFKGEFPIHHISPFVSPLMSRNVLAVTGACMAVSRNTINKIGRFNEKFIICGSDVEFCIRAYNNGYINKYNSFVKLYHLESKTRDKYIPKNDFICSEIAYKYFLEKGDPYFNLNLDKNSLKPKEAKNELH